MMHKVARKHQNNEVEEINHYRSAQHGFIKLNFDNANPSEAWIGGVIHRRQGKDT